MEIILKSGEEKEEEEEDHDADRFLQRLGFSDRSRRARLGIDPELRHLIRFHVGSTPPLAEVAGATRSGSLMLLKGLVFPHWKRRPALLLGDRLFLYPAPGSLTAAPEELRVESVSSRSPRGGRLVLRVAAQPNGPRRHVFLGFGSCWERDQWAEWLQEIAKCW
ncbi:hypothetical protein FOCC_FOCC010827 [Frankliniella occidentalis]|nr:hypothetical protein FOCC_FOCC010827 [Frankliniella occidentalis]